jgi:peptidoglycan-associated lipoprotein
MVAISYGKERPVCTEHSEACWARNRRARFLVKPL